MEKNLILTRAKSAEMSHDFGTAARLYKQLVDDDPSNVEYLKSLGSIYVQAGEDEKAISYYEQILAYYPHYIDAMNSLGAIYRRLKRYEESITILQRALDEDRQVPSVNYNLGFTYKEMGNYDDAIDAFNSVISVNPNDVLAHNHLGTIYLALKEYQKSIQAFRRGLQIDPNHPILNYNLARCYEAEKNYPDAIRCYGLTLKTRPGWLDAVRDFSTLLIKCQKNEEAQGLVQQAIKLHPDDTNLLCLLGRIYINEFDFDNAVRTYKLAKQKKSDDIKVLVGLSESYEKNNNLELSSEAALDALDVDPDNAEALKQYTHTLLSMKDYDMANENLKALLEKEDSAKDVQTLDLQAQYHVCTGDDAKAKEFINKIQRVNHHYKDFMINIAQRYAQKENYEQAELYANRYVESRPQNPDGYMSLGLIYEQKGDFIGAKNFFGKSTTLRIPNVLAKKKIESLTSQLNDLDMYMPLQEIDPEEEAQLEQQEAENQVEEEATAENADEFDFEQMGNDVPSEDATEEEKADYFEDLANNVNDEFAKEEEEDTFEIQDPDKFDFADEETSFDFDQQEDEENPLTKEESEELFDEFSPKEAIPEMEKMQNEAKESAEAAKSAADNAQKLMEQLQSQQALMADQLRNQQELLNEQMKKNAQNMVKEAVCDFLENDTPEPESEPIYEKPAPQSRAVEPEPAAEPVISEPVFDEAEAFENTTVEPEMTVEEPVAEEPAIEEESVIEEEPAIKEPSIEELGLEDMFGAEVLAEDPEADDESVDEQLPEENIEIEVENPVEEPVIIEAPVVMEETIDEDDPFAEGWDKDDDEVTESEDNLEAEQEVVPEIDEATLNQETSAIFKSVGLNQDEDPFEHTENLSVEDMLEKIQRILNDDETARKNAEKLELFKTLRILSSFLPETEKNTFQSCRMRMMIEYIIAKLSGKPGLLLTAQSLIKSGILGDDYNNQLTKDCETEMGNELIRKVIVDMKKLAGSLEDEALAKSLSITADGILEQIELVNQKSEIF